MLLLTRSPGLQVGPRVIRVSEELYRGAQFPEDSCNTMVASVQRYTSFRATRQPVSYTQKTDSKNIFYFLRKD